MQFRSGVAPDQLLLLSADMRRAESSSPVQKRNVYLLELAHSQLGISNVPGLCWLTVERILQAGPAEHLAGCWIDQAAHRDMPYRVPALLLFYVCLPAL